MKVIVTGASGVLGSAVFAAFKAHGDDSIGLDHPSRANGSSELRGFDLLDAQGRTGIEELVAAFKPDWLIHCAGERRPDVVEKNPERTEQLNAGVPGFFAELSAKHDFFLVHVSTDYIFDGNEPPYTPSSRTNPLQTYGKSKLGGERAVLAVPGARSVLLRIPALYGPAPNNADSAVNILLDVVQDQSGRTFKMDHYAPRFPTNVLDVAGFLVRLSQHPAPLPQIVHYSAGERYTKYEMCRVFAKILGLPHEHIVPDAEPPSPELATVRPRDPQLGTAETEALGIKGGLGCCNFEEWWTGHLKNKN